MDASVKGCLDNLNQSYKAFSHNGKRMTKQEVKAVLEYAVEAGYESTSQLSNAEINEILNNL